jgi:hypothetical protein
VSPSRRRSEAVQRNNNCRLAKFLLTNPPAGVKLSTPASEHQQKAGQSVRASTLNSQPLDNMLRIVTAIQQIMTEFNGGVYEEEK